MSNVPKLRFKEFSGEWIFTKLDNVVTLVSGQHLSPEEYQEQPNGLPYFSGPSDFTNNLNNVLKWSLKESKVAHSDDVLITVKGSGVGELFYLYLDKVAIGRQIMAIRAKKASSIILYQLLQSRKYNFQALASGNMIPGLSRPDILNQKFYLPSKQEQEKIASFLIYVDTKIEQLTKKEELLQQYKKGVMQKIFNQEIKFKKDDGTEFDEWEEKNLSSLCTIKKGSQLNKDTLTETGDYPAVNGGINPSGHTTQYNTEENTITISEGGNSCGYVNFITTKFWSGGHNYSLQDLKKSIENLYLFQYLKHNENSIMSLRVGSGLPNIQKGAISNFLVLVPCNKEQNKIANFLSSIDTKIEQTQKQLESSKEFKKALLQQMFV
ncbi:restriction endonuclease subunit S [Arcobacter porcinus]|uniref:Type I restriction enzyme specificity protein n=1 Tax=Arcobacter porcinus TaxID=1935204 RepID=A0ABX2YGQ9_9BACT|nr:restriction endonuclease subunit S [Arcobacter porcinus]OCL93426.1 putative type I restriction enzyme specificity protein [Arcobacter porcinus]